MDCLEYLLCSDANIPEPCYVLDVPRLRANLAILDQVQQASGAKILLALKAFSAWRLFPEISRLQAGPLWGVCASSVDEARLGREEFHGEVHAYAAAWAERDIHELLELADHIVFNTISQYERFKPLILQANHSFRKEWPIDMGLRLNPELSQGATPIYDPCAPGSRLGIRASQMPERLDAGISGLHFHALCEQDAKALANILEAVETRFAPALKQPLRWLNFGGGHHITRAGYDLDLLIRLLRRWQKKYGLQIYLEPGEAVALNAGWLVCDVLDVVEADVPVLILDTSAACHMPDVLEMPYKPPVFYLKPGEEACIVLEADKAGEIPARLAGKSCLAGDIIGDYRFVELPRPGDRLVFGDMAIYSMVKNNTFNGLRLPSIATYSEDSGTGEITLVKSFGYEDFKGRLS